MLDWWMPSHGHDADLGAIGWLVCVDYASVRTEQARGLRHGRCYCRDRDTAGCAGVSGADIALSGVWKRGTDALSACGCRRHGTTQTSGYGWAAMQGVANTGARWPRHLTGGRARDALVLQVRWRAMWVQGAGDGAGT